MRILPSNKAQRGCRCIRLLRSKHFHASGIALSTNMPTYVLDPYFNEVREVTEFAQKLKKKATLAIYKAVDAKSFGIIVGAQRRAIIKIICIAIQKRFRKEGKAVQLFALTDITSERLNNLKE